MLWSLEALTAFPLAVNMSALYNTNVNITTPLIRAVGQTVSLSVEEPEPLAMLRRSSFVKPDLCFWGLFYPVATYKCCFWSGAFLLTAEREIHRRDCPSTDSASAWAAKQTSPSSPSSVQVWPVWESALLRFYSNTRNVGFQSF